MTKEWLMNNEEIIWNMLKKKQIYSLSELKNTTGIGLAELLVTIGKMAKDGKIKMSISVNTEAHYMHLSRCEYLFAHFMDLVSTHLVKERSISFYASKMCISPQYLSTVVKQVSGKNPTVWIREKLMDEIKYRLCCTQDSIKEIAYGLNFPNLSFFGKYFKANSGLSPSLYRTVYSARTEIK